MTGLGMILLGGEAYITFKPNLIDEHGAIGDDSKQEIFAGLRRPLCGAGHSFGAGKASVGGLAEGCFSGGIKPALALASAVFRRAA